MAGNWPRGLNGVLGIVLGLLLGTVGTVFILAGEPGGDTWVNLGGKKIDADLVGATVLAVGALAIAVSLLSLRQRRT